MDIGEAGYSPGSVMSCISRGARRPDGKARGASIVGLFERRATQPAGMPRPRIMQEITFPGD